MTIFGSFQVSSFGKFKNHVTNDLVVQDNKRSQH